MKNLFKNLMLVAVAAMAFTACSEDNNEVNNVEKKTVISGVLNIVNDETRSGFTGSYTEGEETYYQSSWDGGETIKIFVDGFNPVTTTIDAEGRFEVELDGEVSLNTSMTVCSPASAWESAWTATIPTEQTPRANSVDPAAHVLQSTSGMVGSTSIEMSLQKACYGKMTVNVPEDFEIEYVELDLTGNVYFSWEDTLSYKLNADYVENNTFWFAIPSTLGVSEFTVTAYGAEGKTATKSVVIPEDRELKFNWGKVSTFSVSNLDIDEGIPADAVFTGAAWTGGAANDKLIQFYSNELGTLQLNFYNCNWDSWIDARTYGFASSGDIYPGGNFSWWQPLGGEMVYVTKGTVVVTIVDGVYHFEFNGLTDNSGSYSLTSSFTGEIAGLEVPDTRTPLATPNVTASAEGKTITLSWDPVDYAISYEVFCASTSDIETINTTDTTVTIEAPTYMTSYEFAVTAIALDSDPTYKSSEAVSVTVATGSDPDMVIVEFTTCELNQYISAQWRVSYNLYDESGSSMTLWLTTDHGANDVSLGSSHNYYLYYSSPGSVGNYNRFSTENVIVNGEYKTVSSGNVDVTNLGTSWDVTITLTFSDGGMQVFTYSGGIGVDSGDNGDGEEGGSNDGEFVPDFTITSFSYVKLSTNYYTHQWSVSTSNGLSFNIYTPYSQGAELLEGTYTYYSGSGNTNGDYTFSTRMFSPAPGSGSMVVTKSGDTYTINLTLVVGTATQKYQFVGAL